MTYRRRCATNPVYCFADGDHMIVHGRLSGIGRPKNWIAADIVDGVLAEHCDVLQDEATGTEPQSGLPMFGEKFPQ